MPCLLNADLTPAYVSTTEPVRVGAPATFTAPVIVDYRFNLWRFQPTSEVVGPAGDGSPVMFTNTRTAAPDVDGDRQCRPQGRLVQRAELLHHARARGHRRLHWPTTTATTTATRSAAGCDQRGAWDAGDLQRQQEKIVSAINALDADVVGLMEIENSARLGEQRDEALATLVAALNARAGARDLGLRAVLDGAAAGGPAGRHHQRHHLQAGLRDAGRRVPRPRHPERGRDRPSTTRASPSARSSRRSTARARSSSSSSTTSSPRARPARSRATRTPATARVPR